MIVTNFLTKDELSKWTGLHPDDFWDAGFDLDDCDCIIETAKPLRSYDDYTYDYNEIDEYFEISGGVPPDAFTPSKEVKWLFNQMKDYCAGFHHTEYKGKHYYTVHHA